MFCSSLCDIGPPDPHTPLIRYTCTVIVRIKAHFARYGIPAVCHTDNGPQFVSEEYASFAKDFGFRHTTSSPYHSQGNGKAEAAVKIVKSMLRKSADIDKALLHHRNTPPQGHAFSPAQRMLCRRTRTTLPTNDQLLQPQIIPSDTVCQNIEKRRLSSKASYDKYATSQTHRELEVGDQVYAKPPPQSHGRPWSYGNIVRKNGSRSYTIKTPHSTLRRNRVDLRPARAEPPIHTTPHHGLQGGSLHMQHVPTESPAVGPVGTPDQPPSPPQLNNAGLEGSSTVQASEVNIPSTPLHGPSPNSLYITRYGRAVKKPKILNW